MLGDTGGEATWGGAACWRALSSVEGLALTNVEGLALSKVEGPLELIRPKHSRAVTAETVNGAERDTTLDYTRRAMIAGNHKGEGSGRRPKECT
jgi:hypothetical protein